MTYRLLFKAEAKKEWDKLDSTIRDQVRTKRLERIESPKVESARLNELQNCNKIKLRSAGYRLVYQVRDEEVVVSVIAVRRRERNAVYNAAVKRV